MESQLTKRFELESLELELLFRSLKERCGVDGEPEEQEDMVHCLLSKFNSLGFFKLTLLNQTFCLSLMSSGDEIPESD